MLPSIIFELEATTSSNKKLSIMSDNQDNRLFCKVLKYAYDPTIIFGIKQLCDAEFSTQPTTDDEFEKILNDILDKLVDKKIKGLKAQDIVCEHLKNCDKNYQPILRRILTKDLRCGINVSSINKAIPNLITEIGYMGAVPFDEAKLDKVIDNEDIIIAQEKIDGEFLFLKVNSQTVNGYTRRSKEYYLHEHFINNIKPLVSKWIDERADFDEIIFCGELIIKGIDDRLTSNGILNRLNKYYENLYNGAAEKKLNKMKAEIEKMANMTFEQLGDNIIYVFWDYVDNSNISYLDRIIPIFKLNNRVMHPVESRVIVKESYTESLSHGKKNLLLSTLKAEIGSVTICKTEKSIKHELDNFYNSIIVKGGEGIIIKASSKPYKKGKPPYQIKRKDEYEFELKVKDFVAGDKGKKFEHTLGRIYLESEDGKLKTYVGGFSDQERDDIWNNKHNYINKIVTVRVNFVSQSKENDYYSCGHPRIIAWREDKDKADNIETILEIVKGD